MKKFTEQRVLIGRAVIGLIGVLFLIAGIFARRISYDME